MQGIYRKKCMDFINGTMYNWTLNLNSIDVLKLVEIEERVQECIEQSSTSPPQRPTPLFGLSVGLIVYYSLIMLLGLTLNIALLVTIVCSRGLRTLTNMFMCSLSTADLLLSLIVAPLKILEFTLRKQFDMLDILFPLLGRASLFNLCAVTVDRYISITCPLTYEYRVTGKRAAAAILVIWFLAAFPAGLHFAFRSGTHKMMLYQDLVFVVAFFVPFISVLFTNGRILFVARKHARQIAHDEAFNRSSSRSFTKKMKIIRVLGILVGTFVLSWLPYCILTVYENHAKVGSYLASPRHVTAALACSTAVTNSLLYGILRLDVREALLRSLQCQNPNQTTFSITADFTTNNVRPSIRNSKQNSILNRVPAWSVPVSLANNGQT